MRQNFTRSQWSLRQKVLIDPHSIARLVGLSGELSARESRDVQFAAMVIGVSAVTIGWFLLSTRFAQNKSVARQQEEDAFFRDLDTPVTADSDEHRHTDAMQCKVLGRLCFAFCAGSIMVVGALLYRVYRRKKHLLVNTAAVFCIFTIAWL